MHRAFAQAPSRSRRSSAPTTSRRSGTAVPAAANLFELVNGAPHLTAAMRSPGSGPSGAVRFSFAGSVQQLLDGDVRAQVREPVSAGPATALLAAAAIAAFLIDGIAALAAMTVILLLICLRAPVQRRWLYIGGALFSALGVIVISPLTWSSGGGTLLWEGPTLPVIGPLDLSTDEIQIAIVNGLRLAVVALAFSAYTLLVDHDRLVSAAGFARRSALAVALATRLVPSLERDAAGFAESVRGRGVELHGVRGYAMLLSPLVAGSLERATGLAEAMEARGFGRSETTRAPRPPGRGSTTSRSSRRVATRSGGDMALARVEGLSFTYPGGVPAVRDLSLELHAGEVVALLGASGQRQVDAPARAGGARPALSRWPLRRPGRGRRPGHADARAGRAGAASSRRSSRIRRTRS